MDSFARQSIFAVTSGVSLAVVLGLFGWIRDTDRATTTLKEQNNSCVSQANNISTHLDKIDREHESIKRRLYNLEVSK